MHPDPFGLADKNDIARRLVWLATERPWPNLYRLGVFCDNEDVHNGQVWACALFKGRRGTYTGKASWREVDPFNLEDSAKRGRDIMPIDPHNRYKKDIGEKTTETRTLSDARLYRIKCGLCSRRQDIYGGKLSSALTQLHDQGLVVITIPLLARTIDRQGHNTGMC